jgi:hypothetical protein
MHETAPPADPLASVPPITVTHDRQDLLLRVASYALLGLATAIAVAHAAITQPVLRSPPVMDRVVSPHSCRAALVSEAEFEDWGLTLLARRSMQK